jgi:hypothetical protein
VCELSWCDQVNLISSKIIRFIDKLRKKLMENTFRHNFLSILYLKLNRIKVILTWSNQLGYILCEMHIICKIILMQRRCFFSKNNATACHNLWTLTLFIFTYSSHSYYLLIVTNLNIEKRTTILVHLFV